MTVSRWLAFVCTVAALTFTTGCSAILGDFSDTPAGSDGGAPTDGSSVGPTFDASGTSDGAGPADTGPINGLDSSGIDSPVGPGEDAGGDAAPPPCTNGASCPLPNANGVCVAGACAIDFCVNGYLNCDGLPANGCEVDGNSDPKNCGKCSNACTVSEGTQSCSGGQCSTITCDPGYADCNNNATDGCETSLTTVTNCGTCKYACGTANGTPSCSAPDDGGEPQCTYACNAPYAHCPGAADSTGCGTNTNTDNSNCGTCGNTCALGQTCSNGTCSCNGTTCPGGCCDEDGGACLTPSATACGIKGNACVACAPGLHCDGVTGDCVCDSTSCPGCCANATTCIVNPGSTTPTTCGQGGGACVNCSTNNLDCSADGTQCICTTDSCSGGCCTTTNTCVLVGSAQNTNQCGNNGNACGKCASGQACTNGGCNCGGGACDGCCASGSCVTPDAGGTQVCGANGGVCAACGANQECNAQGQCVCDSNTCPNGCCTATVGGTCITTEQTAACGTAGAICQTCVTGQECAATAGVYSCTCDTNSCKNGCCTANVGGTCLTAGSAAQGVTACGTGGILCGGCGQGTHCATGVCTCDGTSCNGCCTATANGTCNPSNVNTCGIKGAACQTCTSGACNASGLCQCDSSQCAGCCTATVGGTCITTEQNGACGSNGALCSVCATGSGTTCNGVQCVCNTTSGCTGCCSSATTCAAGTAFGACGTGGNSCEPCATNQHCGTSGATIGECLCDNTSCTGGCCTQTDNGTCVLYANESTTGGCGASGAICAPCGPGLGCNLTTGKCGCSGATCTGCCDASGGCQTSGNTTCGTLGASCQNCQTSGVTCVSGECQQVLNVTVVGGGSVTAPAGGISNCTSSCSADYNYGTSITLQETANTGAVFSGWSGACTGIGGCTFPMNATENVTATFGVQQYLVTTSTVGSGSGTIASSPAGINCGSVCSSSFNYNTSLTLTATAGAESTFVSWASGPCVGSTNPVCNFTVTAAASASATFNLQQFALSVSGTGTGSGAMTSTTAPDLACLYSGTASSGTCSSNYNYNTSVTVTAAPATGSTANGWTGNPNCSTTSNNCTLPVTAAANLTASFTLIPETVTITAGTGNGSGTLTSVPAGINCTISPGGSLAGICSAQFPYGKPFSLNQTPAASSSFTNWTGACSGSGACSPSVTGGVSVSAVFTLLPEMLTVVSADGTVTSPPPGINCGTTCSTTVNYGTQVKLTAAPFPGYACTGWTGGGCSTTSGAPCTVTVDGATSVTANYTPSVAAWDQVWSPNLDYSNGNLSVTSPASGGSYTTTRTTFPVTSGSYYWELTATAGVAANNVGGIGISGAGFNTPVGDGWLGETENSAGFGYGTSDTEIFEAWNAAETFPALSASDPIVAGSTYMFALNMTTGSFWAGVNGTWFSGSTPPAGTATVSNVTSPGPVYPAIVFYENTLPSNAFTANFGMSPFKYAPPNGFNPGIFPKIVGYPTIPCTGGGEVSGNYLIGEPITVPSAMTVTGIGITFTTAVAGNMQLAIYDGTGTGGAPGNLLVSSAGTAMLPNVNLLSVTPTAIAAGTYWVMADYSVVIDYCTNGVTLAEDYIPLPYGTAFPASIGTPTVASYQQTGYFLVGY